MKVEQYGSDKDELYNETLSDEEDEYDIEDENEKITRKTFKSLSTSENDWVILTDPATDDRGHVPLFQEKKGCEVSS